jgi:hypothetical protein
LALVVQAPGIAFGAGEVARPCRAPALGAAPTGPPIGEAPRMVTSGMTRATAGSLASCARSLRDTVAESALSS